MTSIATLGPSNTFSELAARYYASGLEGSPRVRLYPTMGKAFGAVGKECTHAILPIENMTEGYVSVVLDLLVHTEYQIVDELLLPIQFSLVANCGRVEEIERVYAQFVSQGQCERFLDSIDTPPIITTQSNGVSLEQALKGIPYEAAIVPSHSVRPDDFPLVVENIADYANNQTRFVVVGDTAPRPQGTHPYKTSLLVFESVDKPGILSNILSAFATRDVNLMSIMSRPTKEMLGRYHFFIDIDGHRESEKVQDALKDIGHDNKIKLLGSYRKAEQPVSLDAISGLCQPGRPKTGVLTETPFSDGAFGASVFVAKGKDPYRMTREVLKKIDLSPAKGKRVLLKPNAGRCAGPETGTVTHPMVVAAAIDAFMESGAEVVVGESPVAGVKTSEAFEKSGIAQVAAERGCRCIDMDARRFVKVELPEGKVLTSIKVCPDALECDLVVSIPVMKTHMHTGVTLSVKNMKGCLWRRSKVDLHMLPEIPGCPDRPLNVAIADMASVLKPHLSIIDGTIGMEGLGPSAGTPRNAGIVVASVNPFAADAVACALMGVDPISIPHLRIASERGYGTIDLSQLDIHPSSWKDWVASFAPPPESLSIAFQGVEVLDSKSCSACQSTLLMFLKRYGDQLKTSLQKDGTLKVAIGKGHTTIPANSLCIGNCTAKFKKEAVHVSGCPPVASEILKTYLEYMDPET